MQVYSRYNKRRIDTLLCLFLGWFMNKVVRAEVDLEVGAWHSDQLFDNDYDDYNPLPTSPTTTTTTTTHPSTDHHPPHHKKQWLKANSKNPKRQPQKRKHSPPSISPKTLPPKKTNIFFCFSLSATPTANNSAPASSNQARVPQRSKRHNLKKSIRRA